MAATRAAGNTTPPVAVLGQTTSELAKVKNREYIDITNDEFTSDYLSDSELNEFMDQLDKKGQSQKSAMKQTKLDFTKAMLKPPTSTSMTRPTSLPSKSVFPNQKAPLPGQSALAQLKADFKSDYRPKVPLGLKSRRAPVAAPATDAFGRPLDAAGRVIETPRPPPKKIEESSSSESESDDDDACGLFSIAKENKSPPKIHKVEKRKVQLLGEPVRSRIALQAREREFRSVPSERNIRARLEPDLTSLLKQVLGWIPGHTGPFPPGTKQADFKRVEATFTSPNKYEETYEPLLMLECWQHIQHAKSESLEETFDLLIENRQKIDEYVELFVTMKPNVYANVGLLDPDLVIISNRQGSGGKECFAKVQGMKKKKDSIELALRCLPTPEMAGCLVPKATMFGIKLFRFVLLTFRSFEFDTDIARIRSIEGVAVLRPCRRDFGSSSEYASPTQ